MLGVVGLVVVLPVAGDAAVQVVAPVAAMRPPVAATVARATPARAAAKPEASIFRIMAGLRSGWLLIP
jgi:hypothetical protein